MDDHPEKRSQVSTQMTDLFTNVDVLEGSVTRLDKRLTSALRDPTEKSDCEAETKVSLAPLASQLEEINHRLNSLRIRLEGFEHRLEL